MPKKSDQKAQNARGARTARRVPGRRGDRSRNSSNSSARQCVQDKKAVALSILSRFYPFLLKEHRDDVLQDLEILLLESKEKNLKAFSNEAQRYFYRRAKAYGYRRPKGSKGFVRDVSAFPRELGEE